MSRKHLFLWKGMVNIFLRDIIKVNKLSFKDREKLERK